MLGLARGTVALHPYADEWPALFQAEAAQLQAAIGAHVLDIQHVGSTSIPGLPAKPILDIGVAVENFEAATVCIQPLAAMGYRYRGEMGIPRRHYFVKGDPVTHHLHMNEIHSADWQQQIAFRDYLRQHPEAVHAYATLKAHLASQFPDARLAYTESKSGFIAGILQKALPTAALRVGDVVRVRAFKTDGQWYRWWMTTVEQVTPECIITLSPPNNATHTPTGQWHFKLAIRSYYWFDRPCNLLEVLEGDGTLAEVYINIGSPIVQKGAELQFVDHELDVLKRAGQPARIVDEDEFNAAALQYGYSAGFQAYCRQQAQLALELAERWPGQNLNYIGHMPAGTDN
ncbi:MAG: GrpB family protein [Caldilineaceae bacterium]